MKKLLILLAFGLLAASCNKGVAVQPVAKSVTKPQVLGISVEAPVSKPVVEATVVKTEAPKLKGADVNVPKTEPEQDAQIDQNTVTNIQQDGQIAQQQQQLDNQQQQITNNSSRINQVENRVTVIEQNPVVNPPAPIVPPTPTLLPAYTEEELLNKIGSWRNKDVSGLIKEHYFTIGCDSNSPTTGWCGGGSPYASSFKIIFNGQTVYDGSQSLKTSFLDLTPGTPYTYQLIYSEAGRQDSIFNETFGTP